MILSLLAMSAMPMAPMEAEAGKYVANFEARLVAGDVTVVAHRHPDQASTYQAIVSGDASDWIDQATWDSMAVGDTPWGAWHDQLTATQASALTALMLDGTISSATFRVHHEQTSVDSTSGSLTSTQWGDLVTLAGSASGFAARASTVLGSWWDDLAEDRQLGLRLLVEAV